MRRRHRRYISFFYSVAVTTANDWLADSKAKKDLDTTCYLEQLQHDLNHN